MPIPPDSLYILAQKLWWFLIVLGVLVAFHELGHFLAARSVGVRVLKFSIGFGPKLFGRLIGETEYVISLIPLGGYVKLFGEDGSEAIEPHERRRSFAHQSIPKKMFIVGAGPGFNFLLSYLIFTAWLATGSPLFVPTFSDLLPTVEAISPGSPAERAGFHIGDRIIRVNGQEIATQNDLYAILAESQGEPLTIEVVRNGTVKVLRVTPEARTIPGQSKPVYVLGIEEPAPVVTAVLPNSPAEAAGLAVGDRIIEIEGHPIHTWSEMTKLVQSNPNRPLQFVVVRDGERRTLTVTPAAKTITVDGERQTIGRIGIMGPGRPAMQSESVLLAPWDGLKATWAWCELTVVGVYKMLVGEISTKNIGGPIMIASVSGEAAEQGLSNVIFLIAILSINLGILNLLPIPILDGGHLFFFAYEAIAGRPMGERQREIAQQIGFALLISIMLYAFWNDFMRLLE